MDTIQEILKIMETNGVNFNWQSCADSIVKDEIIHYRHCKYCLAKTLGIKFPSDNLVDILAYCDKVDFTIKSTGLPYLKSHRNDDDSHEWLYQLIKSHTQLEKYKSIGSSIKDGKIYFHWYDNGTKTGRITSRYVNIQGLPKVCRPFVVAGESYKILTADYSKIELRLLADLSNDINLLDAFKEDLKMDISIDEAQGYIDNFYQNYSKLRPYFNKVLNLEEYQSIDSNGELNIIYLTATKGSLKVTHNKSKT